MGKGDTRRPRQISDDEWTLRWEYGQGNMTLEAFNVRFEELKKQGKIVRDGRKVVTNE